MLSGTPQKVVPKPDEQYRTKDLQEDTLRTDGTTM
jgi:hypothetical protein